MATKRETQDYYDGLYVGKYWEATNEQQAGLHKLRDAMPTRTESTTAIAERVYYAMHPEDNGNRDAAVEFWSYIRIGALTADWLRGFVYGAVCKACAL